MSETQTQRNSAATGLVVFGLIAGALGAILWIVGANKFAYDKNVFELEKTLQGGALFASDNTGPDQAMIYWGIALLAIGVILLIARWVIAAAHK